MGVIVCRLCIASPVELTGWPGPAHLRELTEQLRPRPEQRSKIQVLFDKMRREAMALGEQDHLAMMEVLAPEQVTQYNRPRGC